MLFSLWRIDTQEWMKTCIQLKRYSDSRAWFGVSSYIGFLIVFICSSSSCCVLSFFNCSLNQPDHLDMSFSCSSSCRFKDLGEQKTKQNTQRIFFVVLTGLYVVWLAHLRHGVGSEVASYRWSDRVRTCAGLRCQSFRHRSGARCWRIQHEVGLLKHSSYTCLHCKNF